MFDFVVSRNQKRKLTKRLFASSITSCAAHFILLIILIEFPQLLRGGIDNSFLRGFMGTPSDNDTEEGRIITEVINPQKMIMPSDAALKRLLAVISKNEGGVPPPIARPGDVTARLDRPPMPEIKEIVRDPDVFLPKNNLVPIITTSVLPGTQNPASGAGAKSDPPGASPTAEVKPAAPSNEITPTKIPNLITSPPETASLPANKADPALSQAETGLKWDNPTGFPMEEYTDIIVRKIKKQWFIPSNLKNSQGRTTVLFYINKNGQATDARIIDPSGSNSLDIAALNAIISSNPFPALPKGFPGDHIGARFVFRYNGSQ